jgi:hypothetical protein
VADAAFDGVIQSPTSNRVRERNPFDETRSGRNFALDRKIEPVVMESEISGLPDPHWPVLG